MENASDAQELRPMWKKRSLLMAPLNFISDNLAHSYLIQRLIRRDLDARYRGPWLGYLWAIIEPILLTLAYSFVFVLIVGRADETYPGILMIGVITWTIFARTWTSTTRTLSANASLFQFTKIPKSVFAVSTMMTNYVLALISLVAIIPFLILYEVSLDWRVVLVPVFLLITALTGLCLGMMTAPAAVRIPDIANFVNFLSRVGFFFSPVMWTYDMLSSRFGEGWTLYVAHLNPVIVPITQMRDIMFGTDSNIPDFGYGIWIGFVLTVVVFGTMIFQNRAHKVVAGL